MSRIIRNVLLLILPAISIFLFLTINVRILPELDRLESSVEKNTLISREFETGKQTLLKLAAHFPNERPPVIHYEKSDIETVEVDKTPQLTNDVKYISTIIKSGTKHYYFKLLQTGRLITLTTENIDNQWFLNSVENDFFILQSGEKQYKVLKK